MRRNIRAIIDTHEETYKSLTPEERVEWDARWKRVGDIWAIINDPNRKPTPFTDELWDTVMNDPEGQKIFNEELDRLLGPEEDEG